MAWRSGSLSRTLLSTARSSSFRSAPPLPRLRPSPPLAAPRPPRSRLTFAHPRLLGELGCTQSLLPLHSVVAAARLTSHLSIDSRACCELSQGTLSRTCQDR
ncbi:protein NONRESPONDING TO OXYLIPINS 2, mitochondrial-like isoform X1 [Magnolia sinica]|uniref:protein NONRESPONDING TO OXYLIPINS 2, mitochondrial-like isoform X1 n=2 Tax=Magnolia sinica TaxID=86752 RepID=UPI00265B1E1A|nr:protein NONRESPONDING TO OXYLIPINS 2, mitochondrial-like isoform X1 [Magnolia sinica]XP_058080599.1 protein NONRESPONDING TO OXYLIPINS 2, mitochondrial-like isoform X1 [Magnolia sinica]